MIWYYSSLSDNYRLNYDALSPDEYVHDDDRDDDVDEDAVVSDSEDEK